MTQTSDRLAKLVGQPDSRIAGGFLATCSCAIKRLEIKKTSHAQAHARIMEATLARLCRPVNSLQ